MERLLSSDTHIISSLSEDGKIVALDSARSCNYQVWQVDDHELLWDTDAPLGYVHLVPSSTLLVADSHSLEVWDWQKGEMLRELAGSDFDASWITMSANGRRLAASGVDRLVVWDLPKCIRFAELTR